MTQNASAETPSPDSFQENFKNLIEKNADGIIIVNQSGEIRFVNSAAIKLLGREKEELIGEMFGFPIEGNVSTEFNVIQKGGASVFVEMHVVDISWENSKAFLASLHDISKRKKFEEELQLSLKRFNLAMQATNDGMWEWDTKETVYYSARFKELLGYSENEFPNKLSEFQARLHPEDNDQLWAAVGKHLEQKAPFDIEYRLKHKNGEYRWFRARGQAEWDLETGKPIRMAGSISDQTEQKKVEEQLRQSQKMEVVGTLAGGVAHDLNNQLTPIGGYLDLVLTDLDPNDRNYNFLSTALIAVHRCREIIQRLMTFSRRSNQERKNIYLKSSFHELESFISKLLPSNISIESKSEEELWPIFGNEAELQSVFMNLAVNARDAMPEGGKLSICMRNVSAQEAASQQVLQMVPYVYITFSDTGSGMSQETRERIFEPFFTTKPVGRGTGLGLAMVYKIVKDHNGYISVDSELGKGTTFSIYIPAKPEALAEKKKEGRKEIGLIGTNDQMILFADDEESIRSLGALFLKRLGFNVLLASDGEEAKRIYEENQDQIVAVIMDMTMPKMTGKQALRAILEINSKAKIVLASGYVQDAIQEDFLKDGAKAFISKPYSLQMFADVLTAVLKQGV